MKFAPLALLTALFFSPLAQATWYCETDSDPDQTLEYVVKDGTRGEAQVLIKEYFFYNLGFDLKRAKAEKEDDRGTLRYGLNKEGQDLFIFTDKTRNGSTPGELVNRKTKNRRAMDCRPSRPDDFKETRR